jgi:hypothetical protein
MNNKLEFRSKEELYNRVLPALYSKIKEVRKLGFKFITEKDIWNYLVENEWKNRVNLELYDLINDILYVDNYRLNEYVNQKLERMKKDNPEELKSFM